MDWAIAIARAKVRARRSSRYMPREAAGSEYQGDDAAGRGVVRLVATEGAWAENFGGTRHRAGNFSNGSGDGILVWDRPSRRKMHLHRSSPVAPRRTGPAETFDAYAAHFNPQHDFLHRNDKQSL